MDSTQISKRHSLFLNFSQRITFVLRNNAECDQNTLECVRDYNSSVKVHRIFPDDETLQDDQENSSITVFRARMIQNVQKNSTSDFS